MTLKRNYLFGTTILAGVMALSAPAWAQTQPAQLPGVNVQGQSDPEATEVGEVVVTGSRIRRDPVNSPTPLIQVTREQLLSTGQSTVIDYLATIPALSNSLVPSDTTGTSNLGLSAASLRSLGTGRTLTLVDGRRHVGSQRGTLAVDVDTIPRLLIENIEIITGGASSVYGADAVSGVLNFQLRKDFEGLEIDANYGMINQDGQANKRISALLGANILDDRLNLWAFAEYEALDELTNDDIDWLRSNYALVGIDADPAIGSGAGPFSDGTIDARVFSGLKNLQRVRWSVVNLANNQPASALNDPDIPFFSCPANGFTNGNCTTPNPGYSFVFEGLTGRPTEFGTRVGIGLSRLLTIGGDGEDNSEFAQFTFFPEGETQRYAAGANWSLTDDILLRVEAKQTHEETYSMSQASFFDVYINNARPANQVSQIVGSSQYNIRLDDNAFLPANVKTAIQNNRLIVYTAPTIDQPSQPATTMVDPDGAGPLPPVAVVTTIAAPFARAALRGLDRFQDNTRELTRFVASLEGNHDRFAFLNNVRWDLSYTYGEVEINQISTAVDVERQAYASDAIVDTAGLVNGKPGEIVCRVQLLAKTFPGLTNNATGVGGVPDQIRSPGATADPANPFRDLRQSALGQSAINDCRPLNIFGKGNQSQAAVDYITFEADDFARNEQEQAIASLSGELWDFWGAGRLGAAVGIEYRREYTEGVGYEDENAGRLTQGFVTGGQPPVEYESEEAFAELSVPLFRDSWLGEYAELSGSYRTFDYTTVGTGDVYGVNLIYRPIADLTFKTSFNTSFRAPNLGENFAPFTPVFANFLNTDPCTTANINAPLNSGIRANRIANCTALAAQKGLSFDFAGATPTTADDFIVTSLGTGGIQGVSGGNPFLTPEESESFTFSAVIQPRMFPDFSLVLDYYEIEITNVINSIAPATAAANCVDGPTLNQAACATIFRDNPNLPFAIGAPAGAPFGAFISGSINYAKKTVRGLDFTVRYRLDLEEAFGRNWGRLDYRLGGTWLIEQKDFTNAQDLAAFNTLDSTIFFPRVRMTSSLTYTPNDIWSVNWSVDWQAEQDNASGFKQYGESGNPDARVLTDIGTGDFARHDFTLRVNVNDQLSLRTGVVNAFDAEQPRYLGSGLASNFDPYGTRFFIGLNYRPF